MSYCPCVCFGVDIAAVCFKHCWAREQALPCLFLAHPLSFDHLGFGDFLVLHKKSLSLFGTIIVHAPSIPQVFIELVKCARLYVRGMKGGI